ncbi:GAF domain-containing protein, partial [Candidatus Latescibacterota bacterium]
MEPSGESLVSKLNKIGIALSSEHNLEKLLGMIVREIRSFTNADGGTLYIKEGDELSFEVAQNETLKRRFGDAPFQSFKIPISHNSIAGHVVLSGTLLNISNLDEVGDEVPFSLETMRQFDKKMDYKSVSMLAVPMRNHKDEIIGVIQLFNSLDVNNTPVPFDKSIEDLVISLASQAA